MPVVLLSCGECLFAVGDNEVTGEIAESEMQREGEGRQRDREREKKRERLRETRKH